MPRRAAQQRPSPPGSRAPLPISLTGSAGPQVGEAAGRGGVRGEGRGGKGGRGGEGTILQVRANVIQRRQAVKHARGVACVSKSRLHGQSQTCRSSTARRPAAETISRALALRAYSSCSLPRPAWRNGASDKGTRLKTSCLKKPLTDRHFRLRHVQIT